MAWTNVFDIGDCTLTVHKNGSATAMTPSEMTADGITLEADANGLVTLTAPAIGGSGGGYEVRVTPSYDASGRPVRVTCITNEIADRGAEPGDPVYFYRSWSPQPAEYEPFGSPDPSLEVYAALPATTQFTPDQPWTFAGLAVWQMGF